MKRRELLQSLLALPLIGVTLKKKMEAQAVPVTKTEDMDQMVQFGHKDERAVMGQDVSTADPYGFREELLKEKKCPKCDYPAGKSIQDSAKPARSYRNGEGFFISWTSVDFTCIRCGTKYGIAVEIST